MQRLEASFARFHGGRCHCSTTLRRRRGKPATPATATSQGCRGGARAGKRDVYLQFKQTLRRLSEPCKRALGCSAGEETRSRRTNRSTSPCRALQTVSLQPARLFAVDAVVLLHKSPVTKNSCEREEENASEMRWKRGWVVLSEPLRGGLV
ncbi:Proteophosphoglycan ppg4 [Rhodotorula toruloides]|nr:Proteophosphoglycan ppg4 [Rhodotorula toruloides]